MAKNNPFGSPKRDPFNTTPVNADPLKLGVEKIDIQDMRKNPPVLPAVIEQKIDGSVFDALDAFKSALPNGMSAMLIPEGSEGLVIKMQFNPEIAARIEQLEGELDKIGGITSQADVERANATLKKTKGLINALDAEGLVMRSPLREKSDEIINYGRNTTNSLVSKTKVVNDSIIAFQIAETARIKKINDQIEADKKAALAVANAEIKRKADIQAAIISFEANVLEHSNEATTATIDEKIKQLSEFELDPAEYEEFLPEAKIMLQRCVELLIARKPELIAIEKAGAEKKIELEATAKIKQDEIAAAILTKSAELEESTQEAEQIAVSTGQMHAELKVSVITKQKGLSRPWTFNEETINLDLLPNKYKTYDKKKIKDAIASGIYEIDGVEIFQKHQNTSR